MKKGALSPPHKALVEAEIGVKVNSSAFTFDVSELSANNNRHITKPFDKNLSQSLPLPSSPALHHHSSFSLVRLDSVNSLVEDKEGGFGSITSMSSPANALLNEVSLDGIRIKCDND